MYKTILYGLKFSSEVRLSTMPFKDFKGAPDITIKKARFKRPKDGNKSLHYKPYSVLGKDYFFNEIPGIALFRVKSHEIAIQKNRNATWQDVFAFFYDNILAVILLLNNKFILHASAININGKAVLFCGNAGDGKSLLALNFMKVRGATIIEDDKCLIEYNPKKKIYEIRNHYPFLEIWNPDRHFVKENKKIVLKKKLRKDIGKFQYDISKVIKKRPVPVDKIILLEVSNDDVKVEKEFITGFLKARILVKHTHLSGFTNIFQKNKEHFNYLMGLTKDCQVCHVKRSRLTPSPKFVDFINEELLS